MRLSMMLLIDRTSLLEEWKKLVASSRYEKKLTFTSLFLWFNRRLKKYSGGTSFHTMRPR